MVGCLHRLVLIVTTAHSDRRHTKVSTSALTDMTKRIVTKNCRISRVRRRQSLMLSAF